jgi:hypothetical protein
MMTEARITSQKTSNKTPTLTLVSSAKSTWKDAKVLSTAKVHKRKHSTEVEACKLLSES